jgi:CheY-like chemotaxis protein
MMDIASVNLLLADDDEDDCMFFKEALEELPVNSSLKTVKDGEQLMALLTTKQDTLPDILFPDINMPRKTGVECLSEIKRNEKLKQLPVIIYSTSLNREVVELLYEKGAHCYIRKPGNFKKLKKIILEVLANTVQNNLQKPSKEKFITQI